MICFKVLFSYISITRASNNFLAGACYFVPSNLYLLRQEMILARQIVYMKLVHAVSFYCGSSSYSEQKVQNVHGTTTMFSKISFMATVFAERWSL